MTSTRIFPPGLHPLLCAVLVAAALVMAGPPARAADTAPKLDVGIGFLSRAGGHALYEIDPTPADEGVAGARLAIVDNNTTGRFTNQHYELGEVSLEPGQSAADEARKLAEDGRHFLVLDLPADDVLAVADALKGQDVVLFNAAAADDRLRGADCRANVLHTAPSRSMLTDALAQFLAVKRWANLFLVVGPTPEDQLYAAALRHSAEKFGLKVVADKAWEFGPLARARADSVTQADSLVFSRGTDYDIMAVADEAGDFGDYISYHTWDPKLVVGTQGLIAASWHPSLDAWGSAQLQSRFLKLAKRGMRPIDYQAWLAVRAVGESVTRTKTGEPRGVADFMLGKDFQLAAFKGVPVSFRPWDLQLRQPLVVAQPKAMVAIAPQPGFLHQRTPLDTLGVDQPETACHLQK